MDSKINDIVKGITHIIDFFFARREQHINVVTQQFQDNFDIMLDELPDRAPKIATAFLLAGREVMNVMEELDSDSAEEPPEGQPIPDLGASA